MSITIRCPGCNKKYVADDSAAGRKLKCKQCGEVFPLPEAAEATVPAAEWAPAGDGAEPRVAIRFLCNGCGKSYSTPQHLAGKRIPCKKCGQVITIPGGTTTAVKETAKGGSRSAAKPALRLGDDGPPPLDLFGLDDEPATAGKRPAGDGILAVVDTPPAAGDAGDDAPVLPRGGSTAPLSEAKKKQIARRAAKIDRMKPSYGGAAVGVSFGTVFAIALFGWRMYRTVHRVTRLAGVAGAAVAAPGDVNFDPKTLAAAADKEIESSLRQPGTAEARAWLDPAKHPGHALMGMDPGRARGLVAGFYERGADGVHVLDPTKAGDAVVASEIVVTLPADPARRKACIDWENEGTGGEGGSDDFGQKYLIIHTE